MRELKHERPFRVIFEHDGEEDARIISARSGLEAAAKFNEFYPGLRVVDMEGE